MTKSKKTGSGMRDPLASRRLTVRVKDKTKSKSSREWLRRQLNDPYVDAARERGFRSRSAFKLSGLDERFHLLKPGMRVLDLGAAPGGWSQVAAEKVGAKGRVLAVDLLEMEPIAGVEILQLDFLSEGAEAKIREMLGGEVDLVLSDMAGNTIGHQRTDHLRIMALAEAAYDFAVSVLRPGGALVAKVLRGGTEAGLLKRIKADFAEVRHAKPPASRQDSAEMYIVARGLK
jgi:23S rRNA (uridine2552-2'-O)-methyltransferase